MPIIIVDDIAAFYWLQIINISNNIYIRDQQVLEININIAYDLWYWTGSKIGHFRVKQITPVLGGLQ